MQRKLRFNVLTPLILSASMAYLPAQAQTLVTGDCHQFRTQTQGGWGSPAAGNNPGAYRDSHFDAAFPEGITLGCDYTLTFSSAHSVAAFLPSGGSPAALSENMYDPADYGNVLAGQLLALTLSVGFDAYDPGFAPSSTSLADQIVVSGPMQNHTVSEVLDEANKALGACASSFSLQDINAVLTAINENYVDGIANGGYLDCPEEEEDCEINLIALSSSCLDDQNGQYALELTFGGSGGAFEILAPQAISISGSPFCLEGETSSLTLIFPEGEAYSFTVQAAQEASCDPANCALPLVEGMAPDCCELAVDCPGAPVGPFACPSEFPAADPDAIAVGEACGPTSITIAENSSGSGCQGNPLQLIRTYTVSDGSNVATCVHEFQAVNLEAPVISCPPEQHAECNAAIEPDEMATASSTCGGSVQISYVEGPVIDCSQFTRTWVAIDDCGYTSQCTQIVHVVDTTPPTIQPPADATIDCTAPASPFQTGFASAQDHCSVVSITYSDGPEEGSPCSSSFVRTWIASDACGNESTAEQIVHRVDMTGPAIINAPPNQHLQCGEIPPLPENVTAIDACSGDTVDVSINENISVNGCRTMVSLIFSATDQCGNTSNLFRTIQIEDTEGPEMICPSDVLLECGDENIDPAELGIAEAFDNCSGSDVTVSFQDMDRDESQCPPTMERVWTAVDTCGNVSNCIQRIMWDDNTAPEIICADDLTVHCSESGIDPEEIGYPEASDDCSEVSLAYSDGPFEGSCPLSFIRTWTASDACGNTSQCSQSITMIDDAPPTIICPPDVAINCGYVGASPTVAGFPTVSDQCTEVSYTYSDGPLSGMCPAVFERTWIATDLCGNTAECVQIISLVDNMPPVITCPPEAMISCEDDISPQALGEASAVDFCNEVSVDYIDVVVPGSCPESIDRIWTATDACGNDRSCTQSITFIETSEPTIVCPPDIVLPCDSDTSALNTGFAEAQSDCPIEMVMSYTDSLVIQTDENGSGGTDTDGNSCGQLRTQTQGGWGSPASGNNPGAYRDQYFAEAFPNGLTIGCTYTLSLTSAAAVQAFLPSGGPAIALSSDLVDPTNFSSVLAGQLVALSLSIGFDAHDPLFSDSELALSDMLIASGEYEGYTVAEVVDVAKQYFGACDKDAAGTALVQVLSGINESFVDGVGNSGFLKCPDATDGGGNGEPSDDCASILRTWVLTDACGNSVSCVQTITLTTDTVEYEIDERTPLLITAYPSPTQGPVRLQAEDEISLDGLVQVMTLQGQIVLSKQISGSLSMATLDLSMLGRGFYMIRWQGQYGEANMKIFKD